MKTRIIVILSILLFISGIFIYFGFKEYKFQKSEAQRQSNNVEVLNKNYKTYKNAYGKTMATVDALKYTIDELKNNESKLVVKLAEMEVKLKNATSIIQFGTVTNLNVQTFPYIADSLKCFEYKDKYNYVSGCSYKNQAPKVHIEIKDSITIVPEIVYKHKFLWWQWKPKGVKIAIQSENPCTEFSYLKYIEIKK